MFKWLTAIGRALERWRQAAEESADAAEDMKKMWTGMRDRMREVLDAEPEQRQLPPTQQDEAEATPAPKPASRRGR
jgi:hypothetical protein